MLKQGKISSLFQERGLDKSVSGFIAGLGGRDISTETIREVFSLLDKGRQTVEFVGLKKWYSKESPVMILNDK